MKTYKTVQALFADEKRWTKGQLARRKDHLMCDPDSADAICFCLWGGIKLVYPNGPQRIDAIWRTKGAVSMRGYDGIPHFNDDPKTTIADIRAVAKEAKI